MPATDVLLIACGNYVIDTKFVAYKRAAVHEQLAVHTPTTAVLHIRLPRNHEKAIVKTGNSRTLLITERVRVDDEFLRHECR